MKRTWKQIGSLLLTFCMVFTMLPTVAFAETVDVDSGTPLGMSGTITAFAPLEEDVAEQTEEIGTTKEELKLPNKLVVTVTASTSDDEAVSGDEIATDSNAQEKETPKETQTTVAVSEWASDPSYDGDAEGVYTFTPLLELPDGVTVADGVSVPTITVTVGKAAGAQGGISTFTEGDPSVFNVTNATELKSKLSLSYLFPVIINVTEDITLGEEVNVGKNNTLTIQSGKTLTIDNNPSGNPTLTIRSDAPLTVNGAGTLTVKNSNTGYGIFVYGWLNIDNLGTLSVQNTGGLSIGIYGNVTIKDSTANISNINNSGYNTNIGINSKNLTIDNSKVTINGSASGYGNVAGVVSSGKISIINGSAVTINTNKRGIEFELNPGSLTVDDSTLDLQSGVVLDLNSVKQASFTGANNGIVRLTQGAVIYAADGKMKDQGNVLMANDITVGAADATPSDTGLTAGDYVWDGTHFTKGGGTPTYAITVTGGTASPTTAAKDATVTLIADTVPSGQRFKEWTVSPSVTFTAGTTKTDATAEFSMPGEAVTATAVFGAIPAVTGTMDIGGETGKNLASNQSGTGWAWDAATATLTLGSGYSGNNRINIQCASTDTITLVLKGNVTMNVTTLDWGINVSGKLTIQAGSYTLDVKSGFDAILAKGIVIESGTVVATATDSGCGLIAVSGDIVITGSSNVTAIGSTDPYDPMASSNGIQATKVLIDTSGVVNASGGKGAITGKDSITITGGQVNANGGSFALAGITNGVRVTGGTLTTNTTSAANGDAWGKLTVSGTNANVAINGSIKHSLHWDNKTIISHGNLTVSGGTVLATGTVAGTTTHTGGTLNGVGVAKNAVKPVINTQPQGATVKVGEGVTLRVAATVIDGGTLSYQWRESSISELGGTIIPGATGATYTPSTAAVGTMYYRCIVTNTNNNVSGNKTAMIDSNQIIVTVQSGGGSGGGGGGSGGGSYTPPETTTPETKPNQPVTVTTPVTATAGANGTASANVSDKTITDAIAKAQADAKAQGNTANGIAVVLNITMPHGATSLSAALSQNALQSLVSAGVTSLTLSGSPVKVTFDLKALQEIQKQSNGTMNISIVPRAKLSDPAKKIIGTRPVYDLTVGYGSGKTVSGFGAGSVSVTIPYTLSANEKAGNVQAVYVDAKGNVQWLMSSIYDSANKVLRFSTNHFSTYGVGYKQGAPNFTDINSHWAKDDIAFVANRELLSGTSATTFSPNTAMTRGMLVTALGRLANAGVSGYTKSSFSDVKYDAYYMGYVEWANKNNIVKGIGDGKFAPDQSITREQMAVIMQNYAKTIGFTLPKVHVENTFADSTKISTYAKDAVKQVQMAGIISGKNGNLFDPQGTATRAEVSAVLRRFVELAISSDTAQGWTMNGSGNWMYYENGKPVNGKKNIGGSTYTFDQYGVTADVPKNLRYTTYTVQKNDSFWLIAHKLGCTMSELERLNNKSRFDLIHPGDVLRVPEE